MFHILCDNKDTTQQVVESEQALEILELNSKQRTKLEGLFKVSEFCADLMVYKNGAKL